MSTFMLNRELSMTFPEGFRYDYTAQGIAMEGETVILKGSKTQYQFHSYYRQELEKESIEVLDGIFASAQWG